MKATLFVLVFSFCQSYVYASESCTVDEDAISNHASLRKFQEEIFHQVEWNQHKIKTGQEAQVVKNELVMEGLFADGAMNDLNQKIADGDDAQRDEEIRNNKELCQRRILTGYANFVVDRVKDICSFEEAERVCLQEGQAFSIRIGRRPNNRRYDQQTLNDNTGEVAQGIVSNLRQTKNEIQSFYNSVKDINQKCQTTLENTVLSPQCEKAYDVAFEELPKEEISRTCTARQIKVLGNLLAARMRVYAERSCEVLKAQLERKTRERLSYNRLQSVQLSLNCVNHIDPEYCRNVTGRNPNQQGVPAPVSRPRNLRTRARAPASQRGRQPQRD